MLLEALNFAASYLASPRKRANEINSSVRLWARARRCGRDWAEHEGYCQQNILEAIKTLPRRRVAVVLGSGLLRDVPIQALSENFLEVRLYDLQHLANVRIWAATKGLRNLTFRCRDLSGYEQLRADETSEPQPLAFLDEIADLDFVISANLLSQIGVGVGRQVTADGGKEDIVPRLVGAHIDGLSSLETKTCLLTDVSYEIINKSGDVLERDDLMHGVTLPAPEAEWRWTVAPFGELDPSYKAVHRVVAILLPQVASMPQRS
jgi:hypothetical protein